MANSRVYGWDDPKTVRYYEEFCRRHRRYRAANETLIAHAALGPGQRVLDLGAGTGRTTEAALPFLDANARVLCVEPADAMRLVGEARLTDPRVTWSPVCPDSLGSLDRILCGAAVWQLLPLGATFQRLAGLLSPGGALCFNIPSLYLGEPDEPGGGRDPILLELPARLARGITSMAPACARLPGAPEIDALLGLAGFRPESWTCRLSLSQAEYRDWLKIPLMTEGFLAGVDPDERARRIDDAFLLCDRESWRWERWRGWTAWKV